MVTEARDPFAAVRARFVDRLIDDRATLAKEDALSNDAAKVTAHRLAGLAGTLGYTEVSLAAKALEAVLMDKGSVTPEAGEARDLLLEQIDLLLSQ